MRAGDDRIRRLIDVGRTLVAELDPEAVLQRILSEARAITGARYAALGVMDESRSELERFLTSGIDAATHRAIGDLPRGRGVLGVLIEDPQPLRLAHVGDHEQSYGFPPGHPPMSSFLGVPIIIRGQAWGNLYLCEKQGAEAFNDEDEEAAEILSQWASTAIENARLYDHSERRRVEAERAVQSLEAARSIAVAIGSVAELDRVLELIVKRGRALVDARSVLILLREGDDLVVAASAGQATEAADRRLPIAGSTSGQVLLEAQARRVTDVAAELRIAPTVFGVPDAHTALLVPMMYRGVGIGVLAAFDRGAHAETFTGTDEELLRTFAASAANAVAVKRSVEAERLRATIASADAERRRWARELHDQTLQALGGLRVVLASALRRPDPASLETAVRQAISDIELETDNLRSIITDLRPSLLDDLGLLPAIEALIDRRRDQGLHIESELDVDGLSGGHAATTELETTIYRLIQEALTNVAKHAGAERARVAVRREDSAIVVEVADDGGGFDTGARTTGFGLAGMRERIYLSGGRLTVTSGSSGTTVTAVIPLRDVVAPDSAEADPTAR